MKRTNSIKTKKLQLGKQTIQVLTEKKLEQVVGGGNPSEAGTGCTGGMSRNGC
jgi:bacteriocin-like protein